MVYENRVAVMVPKGMSNEEAVKYVEMVDRKKLGIVRLRIDGDNVKIQCFDKKPTKVVQRIK